MFDVSSEDIEKQSNVSKIAQFVENNKESEKDLKSLKVGKDSDIQSDMSRVIEESKSAQPMDESVIMKALRMARTSQSLSQRGQMKQTLYPYDNQGPGELMVVQGYALPNESSNFNVSEAQMEGDHHKYRVSGVDPRTQQPFSIMRRLRHFYALRECLIYKFPALYIPPLPRKQAMNNLADETIQLRVFLLNRFIKQLALCPYILESDEF